MPRLLNLLTRENVTYAERARTLRPTTLQYDQHRMFEVLEPGLRVRATFESYEGNLFLCEHPAEGGWSLLTVEPPMDYRGVPQSMSYLGTEKRRDLLFEAWLDRPAPQPLAVLFDDAVKAVVAERFNADRLPIEHVPVLMMLRATGPDGDALRALHALGRWPDVVEFADGNNLLADDIEGLQALPA